MMQLPQDPDVIGTQRKPALMFASGHGHIEVVRLLLEAGADNDLAGNRIFAALRSASRRPGHVEVVCLLLEAGADRNLADDNSFDERIGARSC